MIPARNEAQTIAGTVGSLIDQDYPGPVSVIVVDDNSDDGTAAAAASGAAGAEDRLTVVTGRALPPGWSGKLWAVSQGLLTADVRYPEAPYVLLTDADIMHDRESLRRLAAKAESPISFTTIRNFRWDRRTIRVPRRSIRSDSASCMPSLNRNGSECSRNYSPGTKSTASN